MTKTKEKTTTKRERGRPAGHKPYVSVNIQKLSELIEGGEVMVPKKWLAAKGINTNQFKDATTQEIVKVNKDKEEVEAIKFTLED